MLSHLLLSLIPAVFAITLHEAAHGFAAFALGDSTAREQGRLSLNPLRHIDPMGSIIVPGLMVLGQLIATGHPGFIFGWAKPVPVNVMRFRHPLQGMGVVAAAGPGMNFLLAWLGALGLHLLPFMPAQASQWVMDGLFDFILFNLALGLFNLIPIPPLDGSRIIAAVLPARVAMHWVRLDRYGVLPVLMIVMLLPWLGHQLGMDLDPVRWLMDRMLRPAVGLVLRLAGHDGG
ncbi:site-2 protease family protein [Granulibacter bethesdensis]|uniref:site-2 protease family protein n=1 Tax=Granulibacter bethesdensis TaxID=364410 RepID=UPI00090B1BAA|nr:site-2 protease family protein [Granulibacter bethesdensis]APH59586.1 Membrane endopeptidase, M50 family [Granulibacter bethesdensis]